MGTFEDFGLHAGRCICHFWQGSDTHKLPSQHSHPDAGGGETSFCPVFPVQLQAVWGVQGICAPSGVCDGLAGDKGCSGAFWGKQPFCTKEGL